MTLFSHLANMPYAPARGVAAAPRWKPVAGDVSPARAESDWFTTSDGVQLALTRRRASRTVDGRPQRVILVAPGLFTSRDCPEHQAVAEHLTEIADVVSVDMRGHGESEGRFTWGTREPADVAGLAAHLRRNYERIGAVGFSFGGYHVGAAAALYRSFDAVAMVATPRNFSPLDRHFLFRGIRKSLLAARRRRGYAGRFSLRSFCRGRQPASAFVRAIAPTPLLIAHGTGDWLLGTHHALDLYGRASEPKSLVFIEDAPHAEGMMMAHSAALMPPLVRFLDQHL